MPAAALGALSSIVISTFLVAPTVVVINPLSPFIVAVSPLFIVWSDPESADKTQVTIPEDIATQVLLPVW